MRIGEVYRYARPYNNEPSHIDGLKNYFHEVYTEGMTLPLLESGISPIAKVKGPDGTMRIPAILRISARHQSYLIGSVYILH